MKRPVIAAITVVITLAAGAFAQHHAGPGGGPGAGPGGGPGAGGFELLSPAALVDFLDLSEAQQEQLAALRESQHAAIQPLAEQMRAKREELQAAVEAGNAQQAGELLLAIEALRTQIEAARSGFDAQFEALLTAGQMAKWEIYKEIRDLRGHGQQGGPGGMMRGGRR